MKNFKIDEKKKLLTDLNFYANHKMSDGEKNSHISECIEQIEFEVYEAVINMFRSEYENGERKYFPKPYEFNQYAKRYKKENRTAPEAANCRYCDGVGSVITLFKKTLPDGSKLFFPAYGLSCNCKNAWDGEGYPSYFNVFREGMQFYWDEEKHSRYTHAFDEIMNKLREYDREDWESHLQNYKVPYGGLKNLMEG